MRRQQTFGYTHEELKILIGPDGRAPAARRSARWAPTRRSPCCPTRPRLLFDYFQQLFAQVTNPPLDAIREELVTTLGSTIGPEANLLAPARRRAARSRCRSRSSTTTSSPSSSTSTRTATCRVRARSCIHGLYPVAGGGAALARGDRHAPPRGQRRRSPAGARIIVLSDRDATEELAPIPSLLITAAVHHHLIREKTRTQVGLVIETGEAREVHHMALLLGYGAGGDQPVPRVRGDRGPDHRRATSTGSRRAQGGEELHQGRGQGRAEGDVEDGHLDGRVLHRRAGLRGDRPRPGARRRVLHRHRDAGSAASGSTCSRPRSRRATTASPTRPARRARPPRRSSSAASTSGAARASTTSSTRRRCSSCSTRPRTKRYDVFKQYTSLVDDQSHAARDAARPVRASSDGVATAGADRRGRAGRATS